WFENLKFTLGTDEFSTQQFSIYPNPAKNSLNFKGFNENLEVSVFDILGKQVMTTSLSMNQSLDISGLNNGMYILKFEGINSTFKFIKQ
ncbi:MAG: T9SS type A sorting domain-containing protein, partial [Gelidibacter sp.]|nr:T9SS type A sorting domain-containing protein [Gelidibacter sp.]